MVVVVVVVVVCNQCMVRRRSLPLQQSKWSVAKRSKVRLVPADDDDCSGQEQQV
jgi:hypothetical protein